MRRTAHRVAAAVGLAAVRLGRTPRRTALVVVGVAVAVLAVTLLASTGAGVLATGEQKFDQSGRDLWVSGGPLELRPRATAPVANSLVDAHAVAAAIERRERVAVATPLAFQALYVGRNASEARPVTGVGIPRAHAGSMVSIAEGRGLERPDVHYANGTYGGPMTYNAVVDPRTADRLNVSVGDGIGVGASRAGAAEGTFTVVGTSPTFAEFLGTETVILHLSELQALAGTTGADRASFITVRLAPGADPAAVRAALQRQYPDLQIRTNREQLRAFLGNRVLVVGSAAVLVALAVVAGLALTVNLLLLSVAQRRREIATLRALGLSPRLLAGIVGTEGLVLGAGGGLVGLAVTPAAVAALNRLVAGLVGFESLLRTPTAVYLAGGGIAVGIGAVSGAVAAWYLGRTATAIRE